MITYNQLENNNLQRITLQKTKLCLFVCIAFAFLLTVLALTFCFSFLDLTQLSRTEGGKRLVCYYSASDDGLRLLDVPGNLCTHINLGVANVENLNVTLSSWLHNVLQNEIAAYRKQNPQVKLLLWIGGGNYAQGFGDMVRNHAKRKAFLRAIKFLLHQYPALDGIDLDWEFPTAYDKQRQHFTQLLYEIRQEWKRERRPNRLLSVAVAAPEGIAYFSYDIPELNRYVDHVNIMTYDFHFYREDTPFTGLNAPLYARSNEHSIMGTFNINYTVRWWLANGIDPHKLVVGLPTYGHSFTLVNPFNTRLGAPASGFGSCGQLGFATHSEFCDCAASYFNPTYKFDNETCSPIFSAGLEWISYENPKSILCKTKYIKSLNVGGVMIFSLNADDIKNSCHYVAKTEKRVFPLIHIVKNTIMHH